MSIGPIEKKGATYNILDTRIKTSDQHDETKDEHKEVHEAEEKVLPRVPLALAEEEEPHDWGEIE